MKDISSYIEIITMDRCCMLQEGSHIDKSLLVIAGLLSPAKACSSGQVVEVLTYQRTSQGVDAWKLRLIEDANVSRTSHLINARI